jgi:hypothetical protein
MSRDMVMLKSCPAQQDEEANLQKVLLCAIAMQEWMN